MGTSNLGQRKFKPRNPGMFDLAQLDPGDTVFFETDNSTWFITAVDGFQKRGKDRVMGVALTGNSSALPKGSPFTMVVTRHLEVGQTLQFGAMGTKSPGTSATIRRIYRKEA